LFKDKAERNKGKGQVNKNSLENKRSLENDVKVGCSQCKQLRSSNVVIDGEIISQVGVAGFLNIEKERISYKLETYSTDLQHVHGTTCRITLKWLTIVFVRLIQSQLRIVTATGYAFVVFVPLIR
jgi:hypothetical protein